MRRIEVRTSRASHALATGCLLCSAVVDLCYGYSVLYRAASACTTAMLCCCQVYLSLARFACARRRARSAGAQRASMRSRRCMSHARTRTASSRGAPIVGPVLKPPRARTVVTCCPRRCRMSGDSEASSGQPFASCQSPSRRLRSPDRQRGCARARVCVLCVRV